MYSYIYIAKSTCGQFLKIGKADNVSVRLNHLNKHGNYSIDFSNSIYYQVNKKEVLKIETVLHKTFSNFNVKNNYIADGYTEWFKSSIFENLINLISFYISNNIFDMKLIDDKKNLNFISDNNTIISDRKNNELFIQRNIYYDLFDHYEVISNIIDEINSYGTITFYENNHSIIEKFYLFVNTSDNDNYIKIYDAYNKIVYTDNNIYSSIIRLLSDHFIKIDNVKSLDILLSKINFSNCPMDY